MSTNKNDYIGNRLAQGCTPEHILVQEGDDNTAGKVLDAHKMAFKDPNWDAVRNSDIEIIGKRIISLEKKVGQAGSDVTAPSYTPIPKSASIPDYASAEYTGNTTITASPANASVTEAVVKTAAGKTHAETLIRLDRTLQMVDARLGRASNPDSIPGTLDNFVGTEAYGTTVEGLARPFHYGTSATIPQAIAQIDNKVKTHLSKLDRALGLDPATGNALTVIYVNAAGAGDQDGRDAGNAMSATTVFGTNGLAYKNAGGVVFEIVSGSDMSAHSIINSAGGTVRVKVKSNTTFANIYTTSNSATIFLDDTTKHTVSANFLAVYSGSVFFMENHHLTLTFSVNLIAVDSNSNAAIRVLGNITCNAGALYCQIGSSVSATGNINITNPHQGVSHYSLLCVTNSTVSADGTLTSTHNNALNNTSVAIDRNSNLTIGGAVNLVGSNAAQLIQVSNCSSVHLSNVLNTLGTTTVSLAHQSILFANGNITLGAFQCSHASSLTTNGTLTTNKASGTFGCSSVTSVGQLICQGTYSGADTLHIDNNSHLQCAGISVAATAGDKIGIHQGSAMEIITTGGTINRPVYVHNNSNLYITPAVTINGNINIAYNSTINGNVTINSYADVGAGSVCTVTSVSGRYLSVATSSRFSATTVTITTEAGGPNPGVVSTGCCSVTINLLVFNAGISPAPIISIDGGSTIQILDFNNGFGQVTCNVSNKSLAMFHNQGTTNGSNYPVGGMNMIFDINTQGSAILSGWWDIAANSAASHRSLLMFHNGVVASIGANVLIKQGGTLINGTSGFLNGVAQNGLANAGLFTIDGATGGAIY